MCTGLELVLASGALGAGTGLVSALTAPKPPSTPELPPVPQADKEADKSVATQIKQQKRRANTFNSKDTLLTGGNINDSELNLANTSILGGRA